jgi:hypothetical protein
MADDSAAIFEMLNELKRQLPGALAHHIDSVEMAKGVLKQREQILDFADDNLGSVPQVHKFVQIYREANAKLDQAFLDQLATTTQFLTVYEKFFTAATFTLNRK